MLNGYKWWEFALAITGTIVVLILLMYFFPQVQR